MDETCRVCLSKSTEAVDILESREGLPISVLIMIVCPIKIEPFDNLPKQVCENCLEVVLSAYQLRDESLKSDRYLREPLNARLNVCERRDDDEEPSEKELYIKVEPESKIETVFVDASVVYEPEAKTKAKHPKFSVNLYNYQRKSFIWKFFGSLCNQQGDVIDKSHLYCSKCVENNKFRKFKNSIKNGTSTFLKHLKNQHNIGKKSQKQEIEASPEKVFECDRCQKMFRHKNEIEHHMKFNHNCMKSSPASSSMYKVELDDSSYSQQFKESMDVESGSEIADDESIPQLSADNIASGLEVHCFKEKLGRSFVWSYFGKLCNSSGWPIKGEDDKLFCKICVQNDQTKRFSWSMDTSTGNFIRHLKQYHDINQKNALNIANLTISCLLCNKTFDSRNTYKVHLRSDHGHQKESWVRPACSKSFAKQHLLTNHLGVHGEKSFLCSQCPALFSRKYLLRRHQQAHDKGALKLKCDK